jgi:putative peptide zinc metalloprotease protein
MAVNTKDGSSLLRFAFAIRRITGEVVDQTNAAVAYASCTDCQTTAIAIEILLVEGSPDTFTPTNIAVAINESCSGCETFAAAYQFVAQSSGPVRFTAEGWVAIKDIRLAIKDLADQNLAPADLDAALKDLMGKLADVLANDLVPARPENTEAANQGRAPPEQSTGGETTTEPAATTTGTTTAATTTAETTTTATTTAATTTTATTTAATTTTETTTAETTTAATTTTATTTNATATPGP